MVDTNGPMETTITVRTLTLRLWPAVVFVLLGVGMSFGIAHFGSTNIQNLIGLVVTPLGVTLLLILWWLIASRTPWRDRFLGMLLFVLILAALYFTQRANEVLIVVIAAPYLAYGVVIMFALAHRCSWATKRWTAVVYLVLCGTIFGSIRVDSIGGDLSPVLTWRWESGVEEAPLPTLSAESSGGVAALPSELQPGDWPAFRGVNRDSHLAGVNFATDWSNPPQELWRRRVGIGWSAFSAVGDYLFTQEQRGVQEVVVCYRADTGEEVWINAVHTRFEDMTGSGPRATPTYLDGKLYTQGATGVLQCLDARTGATLWKRNLTVDTSARIPQWGFSSSPLIVGNYLILFSGGSDTSSVVAYFRETGEKAWNTGKGKNGYSSAQFVQLADVPQVLISSNFGIQSLIPETGEMLWEHAWQVDNNPRVVQPLLADGDSVLIGTAAGMGTRRLTITLLDNAWKVTEDWTTKQFRPYFNDYVLYKGYCYGFDGNRITCINASTGERQWRGGRLGGQLIFLSDMETLLVLTEKGTVVLVAAIPEAYREVSRFQAINGKTWNHPVIAHGKLFVRNAEEAACFVLRPQAATP